MFAAVYVNATPESFVKFAFDMERLRRLPGYLAVGKFSPSPSAEEMEGFTLEPDDIKNLRHCTPGACNIQLTEGTMREFQKSLDWSKADIAGQVNRQIKNMAVELLRRYQEQGNRGLGSYHDQTQPFDIDAQMRSLLGRYPALAQYLPDLSRHLLDYPQTKPPAAQSMHFWERVDFGMRPTLRLNHAIAYQSNGPKGWAHVVAVKQLYASHYFQWALDLTACVKEGGTAPTGKGFYLITMKGSTQQGLTGFTGSILRRIIVSKTRYVQEGLLTNVKKALEAMP